jgi:peroxiredoxin
VSGRARAAAVLLVAGTLLAGPPVARGADPGPETLAALQLQPTPRTAAPAFALPDLSGAKLSLASLRGRVVLLYFWATWCPYCGKELPAAIEELARAYGDRSLTVLAVNIEERPETVRSWVRQHKVTVPVLLDADGDVAADYRVTATPTTILVDREGRLLARAVGTRHWTADRARPLWDALLSPASR